MPRKKTKQKNSKKSTGIVNISNLVPKSFLSNAFSNYKKNKELNKIKAIKLEKLKEKNQILKERKDLKVWEERLIKESNRLKFSEDELRLKEKEIKMDKVKLVNANINDTKITLYVKVTVTMIFYLIISIVKFLRQL